MIRKIFFLTVFITFYSLGQVNTEKYRTREDLEGLSGFLELSGNIKSGNTEKIEGNLDGRLDWKTGKSTTFFVFETEHEFVGKKRISGNGLLHIRNVYSFTEDFMSEIFGQINYDKRLLIQNRELLGVGIRYQLISFEGGDITLGNSYMFESEKYDLSESAFHKKNMNVSRWSNYLSLFFKMNSNVVFGGVTYYQPDFTAFSDFRILSENNLAIKISQLFSISINFKIRHDSKPPDGIKKTDTKTDFGITLKF